MRVEQMPDRFWSVLESHARNQDSLVSWLRRASADEIVAYQLAYEQAAEEIADYWDGPVVDGVPYSEDDTEDLCKWVVAQGREAWVAACSDLGEAVRRYTARDVNDAWTPGEPAYEIFFERFGASLHVRLAEA
ncbi:DUF4240 domain-containing protein [Dactylosporangium sp. NPDC048998]|uniref:DUF4240 domain-containing protein n=1 Tax=Dactylosporangium sp. NPDC048998 TaxID=3363976 RepID=UPI00371282AA